MTVLAEVLMVVPTEALPRIELPQMIHTGHLSLTPMLRVLLQAVLCAGLVWAVYAGGRASGRPRLRAPRVLGRVGNPGNSDGGALPSVVGSRRHPTARRPRADARRSRCDRRRRSGLPVWSGGCPVDPPRSLRSGTVLRLGGRFAPPGGLLRARSGYGECTDLAAASAAGDRPEDNPVRAVSAAQHAAVRAGSVALLSGRAARRDRSGVARRAQTLERAASRPASPSSLHCRA